MHKGILALIFTIFTSLGVYIACGSDTREIVREVPAPNPNPAPPPAPTPLPGLGTGNGGNDNCRTGLAVGFDQIKSMLTQKCANCHIGYDQYQIAAEPAKYDSFLNRVNLPSNDIRRMPKAPGPELSENEKALMAAFKEDGYQQRSVCKDGQANNGGGSAASFMFLPDMEQAMLADLDRLGSAQGELNARWVVVTHKANSGSNSRSMDTYRKAIHKTFNSLSNDDDILLAAEAENVQRSIYRIDLDAYGLTADDWALVVNNDSFQFVSQTRRGQTLRQRTGTAVPWMHADNFMQVALGNPAVYNELARIPLTINEHLQTFGVDIPGSFQDPFEARLIGYNGSAIAEGNRLLLRVEADATNGSWWQTFDIDNVFLADKNLFNFPLIVVGQNQFNFQASEVIVNLDNGLHNYSLWNAAGVRQEFAPVQDEIVFDTASPFDPQIDNGQDCFRCHSVGIIPAIDQINPHVIANADQFDIDDVELVRVLYKDNATNQANIANDNRQYAAALQKMGININAPDPINVFGDDHRREWAIADIAGFMATMGFPPRGQVSLEEDFCQKLRGSAQGQAAIGQVCANPPGTVTLELIEQTFPILVRDFRLGLDPIDQ